MQRRDDRNLNHHFKHRYDSLQEAARLNELVMFQVSMCKSPDSKTRTKNKMGIRLVLLLLGESESKSQHSPQLSFPFIMLRAAEPDNERPNDDECQFSGTWILS